MARPQFWKTRNGTTIYEFGLKYSIFYFYFLCARFSWNAFLAQTTFAIIIEEKMRVGLDLNRDDVRSSLWRQSLPTTRQFSIVHAWDLAGYIAGLMARLTVRLPPLFSWLLCVGFHCDYCDTGCVTEQSGWLGQGLSATDFRSVRTSRRQRSHQQQLQIPSADLRHPSFGGRCRKAMLGVCSNSWLTLTHRAVTNHICTINICLSCWERKKGKEERKKRFIFRKS